MIYLKEWRLAKGVSQVALSKISGIPQPALSAIEQGRRGVTLRTLERLGEALGISLDELLKLPRRQCPLTRHEMDRVARAIVQGKPLPGELGLLANAVASLVVEKLRAHRAPGRRLIRLRWNAPQRWLRVKAQYGEEIVKQVLRYIDRHLAALA